MSRIFIPASLLLVVLAAASPAQEPPAFHTSEAYVNFRMSGHDLLKERVTDLDGDGLLDSVVVEKSPDGIGLSAWRAEAEGDYKLLFRSEKVPASSVAAFKRLPLGSHSFVFLLDAYEDNPDEADHFVKLFLIQPGNLKQMFSSGYRVTHSEEDAGRDPARIVDLGGHQVGLEARPAAAGESGGFPELVVRHKPKRLALAGRINRKTHFLIGIRERVYRAEKQAYNLVADRYVDYLVRAAPAEVTASSSLPSSGDEWVAAKAADSKLSSGWVEGATDSGIGESVTLSLGRPRKIRMVRVVPGCAASPESWEKHNRLVKFSLVFEGGTVVTVNRRGVTAEMDSQVEAHEDFVLPGVGFGTQTLVFLSRPVKSSWVKLTVEEVEKGSGEADETCISEISVHEALVDQAEKK
jgi:hypothetical protein